MALVPVENEIKGRSQLVYYYSVLAIGKQWVVLEVCLASYSAFLSPSVETIFSSSTL